MIRKQGDWMTAKIDGELVMMNLQKGHYIGLSTVGARIWDLLDTPQSIDSLCAQLEQEFDVSADICREEVSAFVVQLARYGAAQRDLE